MSELSLSYASFYQSVCGANSQHKHLRMKYILSILMTFACLSTSKAQSEIAFLNAFGEEPLSEVSNLLAPNLRLCIEDNVAEVSRSQAMVQLDSFLKKHDISKKKILHNGKSTDTASSYKVARIRTAEGTYRVFAYSEKDGAGSLIKEIRIDKM